LSKADRLIKELKESLDSQKQESEMLLGEIDNISKAFEDLQSQNSRLMKQLGEKEDSTTQIVAEVNYELHLLLLLRFLMLFLAC
jgi:E3 ubiquitin-protein ligase BRE1